MNRRASLTMWAQPRHRLVAMAASLALWPWAALAFPSQQALRSVVRITCDLPASAGGKTMVATGFVWPDQKHVVTALHAVAGCTNRSVFNQITGSTAKASIERLILQADIALLTLDKSLGVTPSEIGAVPTDGSGRFDVVGYPHGSDQATGSQLTFSYGMDGLETTLDNAYGSVADMRALLNNKSTQNYPQREARIVRVGSTLQPGHSGAPIFDANNKVVAIADGGLFDGFAGMNWSVPVMAYLPRLKDSNDPPPDKPSVWAVSFSATAVEASAPIAVPPDAADPRSGDQLSAGNFRIVRRVTLPALADRLRAQAPPDAAGNVNIRFMLANQVTQAEFDRLAFDIYEDSTSGATVGVPSQCRLQWNARLKSLEALSPDGTVSMQIAVYGADTHQKTKDAGLRLMTRKFRGVADWGRNGPEQAARYTDTQPPKDDFPGWAYGVLSMNAPDKTGRQMSLEIRMAALGKQFMGSSIYHPKEVFAELSKADQNAWIMMMLAADHLFDFARH